MPRSSIFLLIGALALGLLAVVVARFYLTSAPPPLAATAAPPPPSLAKAVVAAAPIAFGAKIDPAQLKLVDFPVAAVPQGSFATVEAAVGPGDRVAQRGIAANEVILASAVSGAGTRLSTSGLIGPDKRAVTVKIGDVAGVAGLIVPGDRVDVMVTRPTTGDKPQMFTSLLLQNLRVLAIDQDSGAVEKPKVGSTATLEASVTQAQKLILAQTVGTVSLMLRGVTDLAQERATTLPLAALGGIAAPRRRPPPRPNGDKVEIVRAVDAKTYVVPRG